MFWPHALNTYIHIFMLWLFRAAFGFKICDGVPFIILKYGRESWRGSGLPKENQETSEYKNHTLITSIMRKIKQHTRIAFSLFHSFQVSSNNSFQTTSAQQHVMWNGWGDHQTYIHTRIAESTSLLPAFYGGGKQESRQQKQIRQAGKSSKSTRRRRRRRGALPGAGTMDAGTRTAVDAGLLLLVRIGLLRRREDGRWMGAWGRWTRWTRASSS